MRKNKYKILYLLLMLWCINSQGQHNISEIVAKTFETSRNTSSKTNTIVSDLLVLDEIFIDNNVRPDVKASKYLHFNKQKALELIAKNDKILSIQISAGALKY